MTLSFLLLFLNDAGIASLEEDRAEGPEIAGMVFEELKKGSLKGETGLYYELIDYKKDSYTQEDEVIRIDEGHLIVPWLQIEYVTPRYYGFRIGAGLTAFTQIDDRNGREDAVDDYDKFVLHQAYLQYDISRTAVKVGRQKLAENLLLGDYYEALSVTSAEIEDLFLVLALVDEVAESDIDKFIEFEDINRDDRSIKDLLTAVEATWSIVPDVLDATLYYYHQGNLFDLYGAHLELAIKTGKAAFTLLADTYATDEDRENGIKDENDDVHNTRIYHISPRVELYDFKLAAGYIRAGSAAGAREGGLIDDYFNPFNEGDRVYEPDAETWYAELSFEAGRYDTGIVFGTTAYLEEGQYREETEFDFRAGVSFFESFLLKTEFALVDSESAEGDFSVIELALSYNF